LTDRSHNTVKQKLFA